MADNKKQHVVPKFYLEGFAKNSKFYQLSMKTGKRYPVDIKDACTRNYFYDAPGDVEHSFEKELSNIEGRQNIFLQKFLNNVRNNDCNLRDYSIRHELARFIVFMYRRGFNIRANTSKAVKNILERTMKFQMEQDGEFFDRKVELTKEGEAMWHRVLIEEDPKDADYLCRKDFFHIYCIRSDKVVSWKTSFYTSDNPVFLETMVDTGYYGIGMLMPGVVFIMPLAHDIYVIMGDANYCKKLGYDDMYEIEYLYTSNEHSSNEIINFLNTKTVFASMEMVFSCDSNMALAKIASKKRASNT